MLCDITGFQCAKSRSYMKSQEILHFQFITVLFGIKNILCWKIINISICSSMPSICENKQNTWLFWQIITNLTTEWAFSRKEIWTEWTLLEYFTKDKQFLHYYYCCFCCCYSCSCCYYYKILCNHRDMDFYYFCKSHT